MQNEVTVIHHHHRRCSLMLRTLDSCQNVAAVIGCYKSDNLSIHSLHLWLSPLDRKAPS
jgi:hypothetical protein